MKIKKTVYFILMFLPFVAALTVLQYLPDKIPAHYGFDNQVTRWGSKYEALLYPIVTVLMGIFLLAMAKLAAKQEEHGESNKNVVIVAGIFVLVLFNILNGYSLYTAFHKVENLSAVPLDINRLIFGIVGVLMIAVGNIMPKLRRNSIVGLRTYWSSKNEETWKKCQRLGGISFIIGGIMIIGVCITTKGIPCLCSVLGIWVTLIVIDVFYTYKIAGRVKRREE